MTRKADWSCHDVEWHVPSRKRPIAYSTTAESASLQILGIDLGLSFTEILASDYLLGDERRVCQAYVDAGYGAESVRSLNAQFRRLAGR